jgi:hypothetical protein
MTVRTSLRRFLVGASATCAAVAVAVAASPVATASAAHPAEPAASWEIASTLSRQSGLALAPVSRTRTWVFAEAGSGNPAPTASLLTGDSLKQYPFPAQAGEVIIDAAASAADNVWAVSSHRVFAWDGSDWRVVRSFGQSVYLLSALPLGPSNVLVFEEDGSTWHYGPSGWARERTGNGLRSGSELTPDSVWAVADAGRPDVAHWDGNTWKRTSLADLLPPSPYLCQYGLTGVLALSRANIWVTASGNCQDAGGPLLLLHYNGNHWARAPLAGSYGTAEAVASHGGRALWLDISGGAGGNEAL